MLRMRTQPATTVPGRQRDVDALRAVGALGDEKPGDDELAQQRQRASSACSGSSAGLAAIAITASTMVRGCRKVLDQPGGGGVDELARLAGMGPGQRELLAAVAEPSADLLDSSATGMMRRSSGRTSGLRSRLALMPRPRTSSQGHEGSGSTRPAGPLEAKRHGSIRRLRVRRRGDRAPAKAIASRSQIHCRQLIRALPPAAVTAPGQAPSAAISAGKRHRLDAPSATTGVSICAAASRDSLPGK